MNTPEDIRATERYRKQIWYIAVPILSALVMVLMYFSGVPLLRQIITPSIEGIYGNSQREFGLLENLQNVVLITMVVIAVRSALQQRHRLERVAFAAVAVFSTFIFLEEIDYGLHIYEVISGVHPEEAAESRNLHNVGDRTSNIKRVVDLGMFILFVVLPWGFHNSTKPLFRHLAPDRYCTATLVGSILVSKFAHLLNDLGLSDEGNIKSNISEFREYIIYWLFMLYLIELSRRRWGEPATADTPQDSTAVENEEEPPDE